MDPCGSNFLCISASYNDPVSGTIFAGLSIAGLLAADLLFDNGSPSPVHISSPEEAQTYYGAFSSQLTSRRASDAFSSTWDGLFDSTSFLDRTGTRLNGAFTAMSGAGGFAAGAAMCTGIVGCLVGGPIMLASADVGASGFMQALTASIHATAIESIFGPRAAGFEQIVVNAAALADFALSVRNAVRGVPHDDPVRGAGPTREELETATRLSRNLPTSYCMGGCYKHAANLIAALKQAGIRGVRLVLDAGNEGFIYSEEHGLLGAQGEVHHAVRVGDTVFDNVWPLGISYSEWIADFGGVKATTPPQGLITETPF